MTELSLNDQFEELAQVTLQKQQNKNESAKSKKYYQDNNAIKKRCRLNPTLQLE